jgi:hypothetical protein
MVSRDHLRSGGLRAYELGRLRSAARIMLVLVPLAAVCLIESRGRAACVCVAGVLISLCLWLRWRDRRGFEIAATGLQAGTIPLFAGLVLERLGVECGFAGAQSYCTGFAALIGFGAGAYVGVREHQWRGRLGSLVTAGAVAVLAAILGCVRLGLVGVSAVVAGIALGALVTARPSAPQH